MAKTRTSTAVKRRYNERNYDRLAITVPRGRKRAIEAHAQGNGVSVNALVNTLLRGDMGLTEQEWKEAAGAEGAEE